MVGNDIVDIAKAKQTTNWQRLHFLDKLFTTQEKQYIQDEDSEDRFLMVWRLWSMKEAAYKLYTQLYPSRFYKPMAFECDIENLKVRYNDFECCVKTRLTQNYILSEARLSNYEMTSKVKVFNHDNQEQQSESLKYQILNSISDIHKIQKNRLKFSKNEFGIPTVDFNSKQIHVSLTHHGDYGAFAISN
ncbi:4'-phosphopantetheinyl transferase superfamily protein [uncultured Winogradskyella sp.]|uniref:4'-phosphopantetheinyl transferase family protein n=1 Tax=uncultured Winogradskyella sp. TaxID=395353 RepID=UPI0026046A08|nr:4'-phosphopantetheinyl transferase superfamily protein [uncultured Winogradskyella sp.]